MSDDSAIERARNLVYGFRSHALFEKEFEAPENELELTAAEVAARLDWNEQRKTFVRAEKKILGMECMSQEDLLNNCVVPPPFQTAKVSKRSTIAEQRSARYYPPRLAQWEAFETSMTAEFFSTDELEEPCDSSEYASCIYRSTVVNEEHEHAFLRECVFMRMEKCGLLTSPIKHATGEPRGIVFNGRPDAVAVREHGGVDTVSCIIELKSSHNLLIPNDVAAVCERYNSAFDQQARTCSANCSSDWSRIGHPLAQMLGYMVDNAVAYGALCSASKTYFVRLSNNTTDNGIDVEITRAWNTCEKNFIRAWAVFYRVSSKPQEELVSGNLSANLKNALENAGWRFAAPLHRPRTRTVVPPASETGGGGESADDPSDEDGNKKGGRKFSFRGVGTMLKRNRPKSSGSSGKKSKSAGQTNRSGAGKTSKSFNGDDTDKGLGPHTEAADNGHVQATESALDDPPLTPRSGTPSSPTASEHKFDFDFEEDFVRYVPYEALQDKAFIAEGRNGVVFSANVGGKVYAVKQFDLSKNFEGYKGEILAYKYLKDAWVDLVPEPHFLSSSFTGNVRFLGMTMGDSPMVGVTPMVKQQVQHKLIDKYKFRHLDNSHGRNYITVNGKLLMIDFEDWERLE